MEWTEQFIQLYTSKTPGDFGKALELKSKNVPSKLYRYRSVTDENIIHRINEIVCGELFLSHPKDLNDPFEVRSMLHSSQPGTYFREKKLFQKLYKDRIGTEEFKLIFEKENFIDELAEHVAKKSVPPEKAEETKNKLLNYCMNAINSVTFGLDELFRSRIRLACFATSPNNLPMWHHYTNGHAGICLEFITEHIKEQYQLDKLLPVNYVEKLPDITYRLTQKENSIFSYQEYQAMHKLKDWSYENEWRLIYDASAFYDSSNDVPENFWNNGKIIEFIRPSRIILGMNISAEHEEIIHETAKQCGIPVTKAECTAFGLKTE